MEHLTMKGVFTIYYEQNRTKLLEIIILARI